MRSIYWKFSFGKELAAFYSRVSLQEEDGQKKTLSDPIKIKRWRYLESIIYFLDRSLKRNCLLQTVVTTLQKILERPVVGPLDEASSFEGIVIESSGVPKRNLNQDESPLSESVTNSIDSGKTSPKKLQYWRFNITGNELCKKLISEGFSTEHSVSWNRLSISVIQFLEDPSDVMLSLEEFCFEDVQSAHVTNLTSRESTLPLFHLVYQNHLAENQT